MIKTLTSRALAVIAVCALSLSAHAAEVNVAVASNFTAPMKVIAQHFEKETGHRAKLSFGATGQFYAQIKNGAPFGILLAADTTTPTKIAQEGLGLRDSAFTYASGTLVLWSKNPTLIDQSGEVLKQGKFNKIAIANPKLAPYGAAALQVITKMGLGDTLKSKIVEGSNISQTFQFVSSGNASLGFVALSQVYENNKLKEGSGWIIPNDMYAPIKQDAIMLNSGQNNPAAQAMMQYLRSEQAKVIIRAFGYNL